MKILIIGGTGFISGAVGLMLLRRGHNVTLFHRNKNKSNVEAGFSEIICDLADISKYRAKFLALAPDIIIDSIAYKAQDMWSVINAFKGICDKLVLLSSADVYLGYSILQKKSGLKSVAIFDELSPLRRRLYPYRCDNLFETNEFLYNYDKLLVEMLAFSSDFKTCVLRLPAVFGKPNQKLSEYFEPIVFEKPEIKINTLKSRWIFTKSYVDNVALAISLAAEGDWLNNEVFNLGDINLTELEFLDRIKQLTNWAGRITLEDGVDEQYNFKQMLQIDSSKFKSRFGYKEIVSIDDAIVETFLAFQQHLLNNNKCQKE